MDWETQPHPFRAYPGTERVDLPLLREEPGASYDSLFNARGPSPKPFSIEKIAALLELSMGLSAWKSYQDASWALRMNPSSGNLHPTEAPPGAPLSPPPPTLRRRGRP